MSMEQVQKALDTVVGANLIRQDLSATISITDGRPRPVLQHAPVNKARGVVHEWDEQSLVVPGSGVASYADGTTPTADAVAAAFAHSRWRAAGGMGTPRNRERINS